MLAISLLFELGFVGMGTLILVRGKCVLFMKL